MVFAARLRRQLKIPRYGAPLALRAYAGMSVGKGIGAFIYISPLYKGFILAMGGYYAAQLFYPLHKLQHKGAALHPLAVVGKAYAQRGKLLKGRRLLPLFPHGKSGKGMHAHAGVLLDYIQLLLYMRCAVRHRGKVGHGAYIGKAAAGGSRSAGGNGFLVRKTRLSEMHMNITERREYKFIGKIFILAIIGKLRYKGGGQLKAAVCISAAIFKIQLHNSPKQKPCRGTARHKSVMKHASAALLLLYLADVPHRLKDNLSMLIV